MKKTQPQKRKGVLSDHKRVGKKLMPPLLHRLSSEFHETPWVRRMVPELIWLALLQEADLRLGIKLAESLAGTASQAAPLQRPNWYGTVSSFALISQDQAREVRRLLAASALLVQLQEALAPLIALYPECPLEFLFEDGQPSGRTEAEFLTSFKAVLRKMLDKSLPETTLASATFIYLAFIGDILKVAEGLALADFPKVADYPNTERSKEVAAAVRSTLPLFFGPPSYDLTSPWPDYFWNRGVRLEPCTFEPDADEER